MDEAQTKKDERQGTQEAQVQAYEVQAVSPNDTVSDGANSTLSLLDQARKVAEELRQVNAETRVLLDRREKIAAEEMLHGRAMAGFVTPPKKEMTPEEYARALIEGKIENPLKKK